MSPPLMLRTFLREPATRVLGPGLRAALWVQGCPHACPGCVVPESWSLEGGEPTPVEELAGWVLGCPGIEGITLSGGEPMAQAEALVELVDRVRAERDLGVMVYTGSRLEALQRRGTPAQRALLARTDLLVDGLYLEGQHADLLWRGSRNQRLLALTPRYQAWLPSSSAEEAPPDRGAAPGQPDRGVAPGQPDRGVAPGQPDRGVGLELRLGEGGTLHFVGVPGTPRFRERLRERLAANGVLWSP